MSAGVYAFRNTIDGKVYVGSAVTIRSRRSHHLAYLRRGDHRNVKLQRAWTKYGESAFVFEVLEYVTDLAILRPREQFWMDHHDAVRSGYNIHPRADGPTGMKHTEEWKKSHSEKMKGRRLTPEQASRRNAAISSAEVRAKISATSKGRIKSAEHMEKIRAAIGTPEVRAKLKARAPSMLGVQQLDSTKELIRERALARWQDPVRREKYIAARRARMR